MNSRLNVELSKEEVDIDLQDYLVKSILVEDALFVFISKAWTAIRVRKYEILLNLRSLRETILEDISTLANRAFSLT